MRASVWILVCSLSAIGSAQDKPGTTAAPAPTPGVTTPGLGGSRLIDHYIEAKWTEMKLAPAARCGDAEFVRRVTLDIVGSIPTLEDVETFLRDGDSEKRAKLVDRLLESRQYGTNWAEIWAGTLIGHEADNKEEVARVAVEKQLYPTFYDNKPYDAFVRDLVTVAGETGEVTPGKMMMDDGEEMEKAGNGLIAFYARYQKSAGKELPQALAGKFSRTFLGTQIQCAQCHDHPFDQWTQEDFYGMAAFFTQLTVRRDNKNKGEKDEKKKKYAFIVEDRPGKGRMKDKFQTLQIPGTKTSVKPAFIATKEGPKSDATLRQEFGRMVTAKENVQFARAAVNRYWGHFFGRGIVNPIDEFSERNKPSHPELLEALGRDFTEHGYDLKYLIRSITGSRAYQLTSSSKERSPEAEKYLSIAPVRALTPEQIFNAVVTTIATSQDEVDDFRQDKLVRGALKQMRFAFGDDEGAETVEFEGTIPGALMMMNSELLARATTAASPRGRVVTRLMKILNENKAPADRIRAIYLAVLARPPKEAEMARMLEHVKGGKDKAGFEDVMWTLMNSSEFLFNH